MNDNLIRYSTPLIDTSVLSVLDVELDGKVVSASDWKNLWELVFARINDISTFCAALEELRIDWLESEEALEDIVTKFNAKYDSLEKSFVHYGETPPTNEHIKFWIKPVANVEDSLTVTHKEMDDAIAEAENLLTNRINTLQNDVNTGFATIRDTLDNDYVSNTDADNKFYNKSEVDVIVNNAVSTKADVDYVNNIVANQVDNLYTYEIIDSEYDLSTDSYTKTVTITGAVEKCAVYVIPNFIEGYPVTAIGASAFTEDDKDENGVILREVVIPDGVTRIGKEAFYGCLALETVTLPDSIVYISKAAFSSSSDMVVYYGGTEEQWSRIVIDEDNNNLIPPKNIYYNQRLATVDYVNSKVVTDQTFDPESENAQSGKAVAEALETKADNSDVLKKQNALVSGENIKTINGESILGSGNIEIQGGSVVDITIDQTYSPESENPQSGTAVAEALKAQYGDVVSLITTPRKYDTEGWEKRGAKGYYTDWSNVSNRGNLKVGQIGLLPGLNITNNEPVILVGEIKEITEYMVWLESITWIQLTGCKGKDGAKGADGTVSFDELTDAQKASLKGETGPQGPQGPQGPVREATYHRFRDISVDDFKFELQKGHLYSFTVDNDDVNSAYIVDTNGKTIAGVAGKTLSGMKNGFIICADRCSGGGLTGELSILNPTAFVTDRWDWDDGYRDQYGPYYLRITKTDGIDIWEI